MMDRQDNFEPALSRGKRWAQSLQRFQRSLFLPLAILPLAGLLFLIGDGLAYVDLPWGLFFQRIATFLIDFWPFFLAVGIAMGLAGKKSELFVLAAGGSYLMIVHTMQHFHRLLAPLTGLESIPEAGWIPGIIAGLLPLAIANLTVKVKMPLFLAFFSGPRLMVLATLVVSMACGMLLALIWQPLSLQFLRLIEALLQEDAWGAAGLAAAAPLLSPLGLDRLIELKVYQQMGSYIDLSGLLSEGETARFFAGDPSAGRYAAGAFPAAIFVVPAMALAFFGCMDRGQHRLWSGFLLLAVLPAVLSGRTEVFLPFLLILSPVLFLVFSLLQGIATFITWQLGIHFGFADAPGLLEYLEHAHLAQSPQLIFSVGPVLFLLAMSLVFLGVIKLNIACPGRQKRTWSMRLAEIETRRNTELEKKERRWQKKIERTKRRQQLSRHRRQRVESDHPSQSSPPDAGVRPLKRRYRLLCRWRKKGRGTNDSR